MKKFFMSVSGKRNVTMALILMLLLAAFIYRADKVFGALTLFSALLYTAFVIIITYIERRKTLSAEMENSLQTLTNDFLLKLRLPVFIVTSDEKLVWYNKSLEELFPDGDLSYSKSSLEILSGLLSFANLKSHVTVNGTDVPMDVHINDRAFEVYPYRLELGKEEYFLAIWSDKTELDALKQRMRMKNVIVTYAMVDNASDVMVNLQDKNREASLQISNQLREWATSLNGIIKEYERDKYIILFDEKYLDDTIENKFAVLDRINKTDIDGNDIHLTVSMGSAAIDGTLIDKEKAAKAALDLALQRGGAQAVVKTADSTSNYGGKTRTVQKQTKIKSRVIANELVSLIKKSKNVIIMGHKKADFDSVAACVGIARLAMYYKKQVNIVVNKDDDQLKGAFTLLHPLEEYKEMFVDAVYGQDLLSPLSLVVVVDVSNPAIFEAPDIVSNSATVAIIDHHRQKEEFSFPPALSYIDPTASSASELVCEILELTLPHSEIKKNEAELLFAGILLDTNSFSRNTGVRTFSSAVYLRGEGGNPGDAKVLLSEDVNDYKLGAKFSANTIVYRSIFAISHYEDDNKLENRVASAKAADNMLLIRGIKASFVLCTVEDYIHVSARSDGTVNVSLILERMGGGGHFNVAGGQFRDKTMEELLIKLKEAIISYTDN